MRNRTVTKQLPNIATSEHRSSSKHVVLNGVHRTITAVIDWFRVGYPDEAPRTGYSPLLALNGPLALTPKQLDHICNDLKDQPTTTTIDVAITKETNRLPTPTQTHAIHRELVHRISQQ